MNILQRICRLCAVVLTLALAAGLVSSGSRVNEICVIGGEIAYCVPQEPQPPG